jgi:hypothetical protein
MSTNHFLILYLIMLFLQTVHIFEEIGFKAYEVVGSLNKYLIVASFLVFASYLPLILILLDIKAGYFLAFFAAILALGNGVVHILGYIKTKSFRGTVGAGVFSGIPLGIIGGIVVINLISIVR